MSDLALGIFIGSFVMFTFNAWMHHSYKKILVMKSKEHKIEYINGKCYYIVPEEKIMKWLMGLKR